MIHTLAITQEGELKHDLSFESLWDPKVEWFWVDFSSPSEEEVQTLKKYFSFHPLAIEDCLQFLQRPKLDYYDGHNFFVLHALNQETLRPEEVDLFVGRDFIVSFHLTEVPEIIQARQQFMVDRKLWEKGPIAVAHLIVDKLVDQFFPAVYEIEDQLNELNHQQTHAVRAYIDQVFAIRSDLLKLRRIVRSMRDLLYRILNSYRLNEYKEYHRYFTDIYDHLLKLSEMIESSREITADMRDSYLSINSHRMNTIMMTLTIVSTLFIPLTFIAGIYGMNFVYIPELQYRYGYFIVLIVMVLISIGMFYWFKRRGWFDIYK